MQSLYTLFATIVLIFLLLSITGILYLLVKVQQRWLTTYIAAAGFLIGFNLQGITIHSFLISLLLTIIFTFGIYYFDSQLTQSYRNMITPDFSSAIEHSAGGFIFFFSLIIATNFYFFNQSVESRDQLVQRGLGLIVDPVAKFTHEDSLKILETISPEISTIAGTDGQMEKINEQTTQAVKNAFAQQMKQYAAIILNVITLVIFLSLFSVFKLAKIFIGPLVTLLVILLKETHYIEEEKEMVEITRYKI